MQDQILGKQIPNTQEGLWSINNQNYLLPDLLQQSQITDSSVNSPQVPLTCQEPQNKPLTKVRDKLQIAWIELQPFEVPLSCLFLQWVFSQHPFFPLKVLSVGKIRNLEQPNRFHCSTYFPPSPSLLSLFPCFVFSPLLHKLEDSHLLLLAMAAFCCASAHCPWLSATQASCEGAQGSPRGLWHCCGHGPVGRQVTWGR